MSENKSSAILEGLNPEQRKAVECVEGPLLIVAGAGSGKTRVLTSRIAYLLDRGADPARVLALTFTKKAAGEMKERIGLMVGERCARRLVMGTFHAVFVRFLRSYAERIGYPSHFTIYDTSDSLSAIKTCLKEMGINEKEDKNYKAKDLLARISRAKNELFTVEDYKANAERMAADLHANRPRTLELYQRYQTKLKQAGVMDFDDILLNMNILLRDHPEALKEISAGFDYILVDEYQDTNYAQYVILKKLSRVHHNLCVVGDDSQSIYAFRGARVENILRFTKDYPEATIIRLERNYRSTRTIVDAANSLIAHNEGRIPKKCYAEGEQGERIALLKAYTEGEEAVQIVSGIQDRMRREHAAYRDFAILYRTNAQSRALEEQLRRKNIPYMIYSGNSFFERAEVKDLMAWFKLVVNPADDEAFLRAVGKPARGIGDTSVGALAQAARKEGIPLMRAAFLQDLELYGLRPAGIAKLRAFSEFVDRLARLAPVTDAHEMAARIADESGLYAFFKSDTSIEGLSRTANVEELVNATAAFVEEQLASLEAEEVEGEAPVVTLADFLENVSLLSNVDAPESEDDGNKVALMTVHSAKGLEFPYVYVAGMEENLFPSGSMTATPGDIEEERRLFYVALTRAKRSVAVSYAVSRMRNGKHESNPPSRFLGEIDARYLDRPLQDGYDDPVSVTTPFRFGSGWQRSESAPYGRRTGSSPTVGYQYGRSGRVSYERRPAASKPAAPAPSAAPSRPIRPTAPPPVIDADFVPVPMTELYEGERVEHNRFGAGKILEISGTVPELKARIDFDRYGEKLLLLKYAKLRPER